MTFTFHPSLPADLKEAAALISGKKSFDLPETEYLVVRKEDKVKAFEIRFEYHCSPFKEGMIIDDLLLIGHETHFYLYALKAQQSLLVLELDGYFGHFYIHGEYFFVADAQGLYCISKKGEVVWSNKKLGIDGVVIHKFTGNRIYGSGEWNPPGGWEDFVLDISTGKIVESLN